MSELRLQIGAVPSTPGSGKITVYPKSDKKLYMKDDTGTETDLTTGGGGGGGTWGSITGTLSDQTDLNSALNGKEPTISAGTTGQYYRGDKTFQTLDKSAVGLGNVDNIAQAPKYPSINTQVATYTLVIGDASKLVRMNVGSANDLEVPPNSSVAFDVGTQILLTQAGAGQTTVKPGAGVTLRSYNSALKLTGQYSTAGIMKIGTDEWIVFGDVTA
jgi:hypothetical protein